MQNLEHELFLDHKVVFNRILDEIKAEVQRPKASEMQKKDIRNLEGNHDYLEADILYHDEQIPDKDKILKIFEVDADSYQEHLNFRRNLEKEEGNPRPKLNFEPVLRELKDILKSRNVEKPSKYYVKTKEGKFIEVDPNTIQGKTKDEDKSIMMKTNSTKESSYHIATSESFAASKMDLFAELKSLKK